MTIIADQTLVDFLVNSAFGEAQVSVPYSAVFDEDHDSSTDSPIDPFIALSVERLLDYWDLSDDTLHEYVGDDGLHEIVGSEGELNDEDRIAWLSSRLHGELEDPDADLTPIAYAFELVDSQGRTALAAIFGTGYSFTGINRQIVGVFPNETAIYDHLRAVGYVMDQDELDAEIGKRGGSLLSNWKHK